MNMSINNRYLIYEKLQTSTIIEKKWENLLIAYGSLDEYRVIIKYSKCVTLGIMRYRRVLRDRGVGNINLCELDKLLIDSEYKMLHSKLEYMFLEPISSEQFNFIINKISTISNGLEKLYNRHMEDKNLRILSAIITL